MIPEIPGINKSYILDIMLLWQNKQFDEAEKCWMLHISSLLPDYLATKEARLDYLEEYYNKNFK